VQEVYDRFAFNQNPKLTKYQLPYIEDLVDTKSYEQSKRYSVYDEQRKYQSKTLSALKDKAEQISAESSSQRPTSTILLSGYN